MFSREFKIEAVKLVTEQGYGVGQAAESLGISTNSLRKWREKFEDQGQEAFPGKGKLTPKDEELRKLREECRRLRMERDILKKATAQRRRRLTVIIKAIHEESRQNYGSPRVFEELQARGEPCNVKTVANIMRENSIVAKRRR